MTSGPTAAVSPGGFPGQTSMTFAGSAAEATLLAITKPRTIHRHIELPPIHRIKLCFFSPRPNGEREETKNFQ
jgi:hypothetical protein